MITLGNTTFGKVSAEQVEQIKKRCKTELYAPLGLSIGLAAQRVGEIVKLLKIEIPRRRGTSLRPFEALYHILASEARRSRFSRVEMSYIEFLSFTSIKQCHYCGELLQWAERINREKLPYTGYNLDRKDSSLGYTKENCVACCCFCNRTKGNRFTYDEFKLIASTIRYVLRVRKLKVKEASNAE
jgi:hypothetical protein